jgi:hypothetical protein
VFFRATAIVSFNYDASLVEIVVSVVPNIAVHEIVLVDFVSDFDGEIEESSPRGLR